MAQAAKRASDAFSASDFPTALTEYTHALIEHPTSPDYFTQRSIVLTRLEPPRYELSLRDAEYAVLLAYKRARREKILAAQQRRVVALHGLGRFADAKFLLTTIKSWRPKDDKPSKMEGDMWMTKVDSKLKNIPDSEKVATVKEVPELALPSEARILEQLKNQLDGSGKFKFVDEENAQLSNASSAPATTSTTEATTSRDSTGAEPTSVTATPVMANIRHEWYQSAQSVTLTLYAKGIPKDAVDVEIQEDSVHISFPHPSNPSSTYTFSLDPLYALIDPNQSKYSVLTTKMELTLRKTQPGQKWHTLEGTTPLKDRTADQPDKASASEASKDVAVAAMLPNRATQQQQAASSTAPPPNAHAAGPSYPTSSRHGPKDWDKLASDLHAQTKGTTKNKKKKKKSTRSEDSNDAEKSTITPSSSVTSSKDKDKDSDEGEEEEEEVDSDYDTGDSVDSFFKKLYAGSDPDTRRAMMKSFYESNGTALSTNWSEVGKKKVEMVTPSKKE